MSIGVDIDWEDSSAMKASDSLVRRIALMAHFIGDHLDIRAQFDSYWATQWPGKAKPDEFLDFMTQPDLDKIIALKRKVRLP